MLTSNKVLSSYLESVMTPESYQRTLNRAIDKIERSNIQFDTIAFRGVSGAAIGFPLAALLNKNVLVVRKYEDNSHSRRGVEGNLVDGAKVLIVDDFIFSGQTIETIQNSLSDEFSGWNFHHKLVGIFLYTDVYRDMNYGSVPVIRLD